MANGSCTPINSEEAYAGVVGMETVQLGFFFVEMNGLKVCATNSSSAYLYAKTREKWYVIAGPEFGELEGEKLVFDCSLYGLQTSGACFHEHLGQKLHHMGYTPSQTDPDFWIKRHTNGHYIYIANYVYDVICFSNNPMQVIEEIHSDYMLKGISEPEYYLGGNVDPLDDTWKDNNALLALSAQTYVKNVVE